MTEKDNPRRYGTGGKLPRKPTGWEVLAYLLSTVTPWRQQAIVECVNKELGTDYDRCKVSRAVKACEAYIQAGGRLHKPLLYQDARDDAPRRPPTRASCRGPRPKKRDQHVPRRFYKYGAPDPPTRPPEDDED